MFRVLTFEITTGPVIYENDITKQTMWQPVSSVSSKYTLAIGYNVYIWQLEPQPSCGYIYAMKCEFDSQNTTDTFARTKIGLREIN